MEYKELLKEAKKEIEVFKDQYTIDESFIKRRLRVSEIRAKKILKELNIKINMRL